MITQLAQVAGSVSQDEALDEAGGDSTDGSEPPTEGEPEANDEPPLDIVFEILKNERRRRVLEYLHDAEGQSATIGELAEFIAAEENDKPVGDLRSNERKRVYVGLYQCHFPKMEDADMIASDRNVEVTLGENAQYALEHLNTDQSSDGRDWRTGYLVLLGAGLAFYLGYLFGPAALQGVFAAALAGVFLLFGCTAAAHGVDEGHLPLGGQ